MIPLPLNSSELTGEQALEIVRWLENNVTYLEHEGEDGFWPCHNFCEDCSMWNGRKCVTKREWTKSMSLVEYVSMRRREER